MATYWVVPEDSAGRHYDWSAHTNMREAKLDALECVNGSGCNPAFAYLAYVWPSDEDGQPDYSGDYLFAAYSEAAEKAILA